MLIFFFFSGGSRPNSAASTAEAMAETFPPDSLDDIKREMEATDMEINELNSAEDTEAQQTQVETVDDGTEIADEEKTEADEGTAETEDTTPAEEEPEGKSEEESAPVLENVEEITPLPPQTNDVENKEDQQS